MDVADCDGIRTRYTVTGSGPAILMYSPGGFDSRLENWSALPLYKRVNLVAHLSRRYTCITFDRRESGESGGRLERVGWDAYVAQGRALLDHLGVERAHLMGGCVGCSSALAFAVRHRERTLSIVLFSPAGGPRYRMTQHERFARHLAYAREHGLRAVVDLAGRSDRSFTQDPRVGPWVTVLRTDPAFAARYVATPVDDYALIVTGVARVMFDRDTVPGVEPEDVMRLRVGALIVPGNDASHAPSAARYLRECLPAAEFWDVPVEEQTEDNAPERILAFLDAQPA